MINGVPYCAMITDLIFAKSEEELLSMSLTKPYEKYFAIQKECYTPYFTECCIIIIVRKTAANLNTQCLDLRI